MKEWTNKEIDNEVLNELKGMVFVERPAMENYDHITIGMGGHFLEIVKESRWERDENLEYHQICAAEIRKFKKNDVSGVWVEV